MFLCWNIFETTDKIRFAIMENRSWLDIYEIIDRAFHNVLRDYKHL